MKPRTVVIGLAAVGCAIGAVGIGYTLLGGASYVSPGFNSNRAVQLTSNLSDSSAGDDSSGIDFAVPSGLTFSGVEKLSADYIFTHNSCAGTSPRFQLRVVTPANTTVTAFIFIGPPPSYTGCPGNVWTNTGNLAAPAGFIDTSQLPGGVFADTFQSANLKYGAYPVTGIQLVADNGMFFPDKIQTVEIDNVAINDTTYTFESLDKSDCKKGGWKNFTSPPGPFKNQGDCVSYFASGGKNKGDGH